jgi:predicted RNase H-like HicB family nuclease
MTVQEAETPTTAASPDLHEATTAAHESTPGSKAGFALFATLRRIFNRPEDHRETVGKPPKVADKGTWDLCITVEPDELDGGFIAETPDVPGAVAQGETEHEALENLGDAILSIVEARMEEQFRRVDLDDDGGARSFRVIL